jgi:DNA-binding transcriptional MerR regulator
VSGADGLLKMSELAERSGVSAGTIKHYLREGLLGSGDEVVRTSRNMAWYPPEYVERIRLIKRLQEERFMPLKVIAQVMADDPDRAAALIELEDRILERAISAQETDRLSRAEVRTRYDVPDPVLDRLAEIGILTPTRRGYDADDVAIIAAISRFRAGGYDEASASRSTTRCATRRRWSRSWRRSSARCSSAWPGRSSPIALPRSSRRAPSRCAS